jgi:SAM-dependent methyltransferase
MLRSGERQVAPELSGIRRDHVARYEFVAKQLPPGSHVLDLACGVGYGARILADAGHTVIAADANREAIAYGLEHYRHERITFLTGKAEGFDWSRDRFDAVISFETIEHLPDPGPVLRAWSRVASRLYASVPNQSVFPFRADIRFHHRHYTRAEFRALLAETGWSVAEWFGQAGPHSEVEPNIEGRTLIAVAAPAAVKAAAPEHVAILGLGPSLNDFVELTKRLGGSSAYCDEVWAINAAADVLRCDRVFHMDDVLVQEVRARAQPGGNIAAMLRWLRQHPGPIYTSRVRDGYPGLVAFPLEDVLNGGYDNGGVPYFNSTAAYAIAYAIHIGVKQISLFGIDYTLPNFHHAERGRACVEFWLGIAAARGIVVTLCEHTTLLDACAPDEDRLYGYDCTDVGFSDRADGGVSVSFADKPPPTAEEVERRYDHSVHPNRLMAGATAKG